jgi:hypothetical protein
MKKHSLLLFTVSFLLSGLKSSAQFTQLWMSHYQHTVSNNYSSESRKVLEDAAGNTYMLSDNTSNLDSTGVITGGTHHYTVINKYSPTGGRIHRKAIEVFNHVVSGTDNLGAFGMEMDASGNIYIGYAPYSATSNFNVVIAKYDSALNKIWVSQYGTNYSDVGIDMKLSASGMVYFAEKTVNGGTTTYSILRTNSGNAPMMVYTFTANTDVINSLALAANEDIYVTGYRVISGVKTLLMAGFNHTTFLPKWLNTYNGGLATGDDYGNMITVGADGFIYVVGTSTQNIYRGTDVVILKHSAAAGTKISWASLQHYTTADIGKFISVPEVDYAYVGGVSGNKIILYRLQITTAPGPQSPGIYRPIPAIPYNAISSVSLNAFKVSSSKKVYITGAVNATDLNGQTFSASYLAKYSLIFGNVLSLSYDVPCNGEFSGSLAGTGLALDYAKTDIFWLCDFWTTNSSHQQEFAQLYDMDVTSPLRQSSPAQQSEPNISVSPNPASMYLTVRSDENISSIEILDLSGRLVISQVLSGTNEKEINVSEMIPGIYICRTVTGDGLVSVKKFTVE